MQTHTSAEWEYKLRYLSLLSKLKHLLMMKDGEWDHLNTEAGEGVGAICKRMSLSVSGVMKKDWEGLHGPTATEDGAIAMHQVLHLRLSKLRPAVREVRLQKDERSTRLNVSPLAPYPLNDMAHSYKQLAFKDTSRSCERKYTNMDGSLIKTSGGIHKKKRAKTLAAWIWHLIKDLSFFTVKRKIKTVLERETMHFFLYMLNDRLKGDSSCCDFPHV